MAFEYDYHVHTKLSYCHEGDLTIENLIKLAQERKLEGFAITDHSSHLYFDRATVSTHQYLLNYDIFLEAAELENGKFEKYLGMIDEHRDANVLTGVEVDVTATGELIFDMQYRDRMDVMLGGIHWLPCVDGNFDERTFLAQFMDHTMMLLESDIDILAHPTRIFRRRKLEIPQDVISPIVQRAKERGIAIEMNSHTQKDPSERFIQTCIDEGVKLAMGTDTHELFEIGDFSHQKATLNKLGVTAEELDSLIFRHDTETSEF